MSELDETFLQECLSELRDGEKVTIQLPKRHHDKARAKLVEWGATSAQLKRLTIQ